MTSNWNDGIIKLENKLIQKEGIEMKFAQNENVIIKKSKYKGQVRRTKEIIIYSNGEKIISYEYYVDVPTGLSKWHLEDDLETYDGFSKEFELGFIDLLTDMNLLHTKDYNAIRELQNRKQDII